LFEEIVVKIRERFDPSILVLQCGADCLANDPLGAFNLSSETLLKCISLMKSWSLPMMILGGGGYEKANTARCWAKITAQLVEIQLSPNIPEHDFFRKYGPDFQLNIAAGSRPEENTDSYLLMIQEKVLSNLKNIVRKE